MLETPPAYAGTAFTNGYEFTQGTGYTLPEYPFVATPELGAPQEHVHRAPEQDDDEDETAGDHAAGYRSTPRSQPPT